MSGERRSEPARDAVVALVERAVRLRFSIDADAFVDHLLARSAQRMPERPPHEFASRLHLDDLYLALACTRGDDDAWRECRDRYFDYIRNFAGRFLHAAAAVDVGDELIADLWRRDRLALYDGRSSLRTWLGAVVANAALNAGKVARRSVLFHLDGHRRHHRAAATDVRAGHREDLDAARLLGSLVQRALEELAPEPKLLLLLYYEQGLTLDEMEEILGLSKATLSRRLQRVRQEVRDAIDDLARRELRIDLDALRERLDLGRLEVDLSTVLGFVKDNRRDAV